MKGPLDPQRLRSWAAPASALAAGLSAARDREPNDAQLRALEAALTASLGAALTGAGVIAGVRAAGPSSAAPVSAGALKLTAVFLTLAAVAGAAVYRHARHANRLVVATTAAPASDPVAPRQPAPAPTLIGVVGTAALSRAEVTSGTSRPQHGAATADQLALIARAQRMLVGDPGAALALVQANRRALAQSQFAQEAGVIGVAALVRLGRMDEAREGAARFVARFPDSVHAARMRRIAEIIK